MIVIVYPLSYYDSVKEQLSQLLFINIELGLYAISYLFQFFLTHKVDYKNKT